MIISNILLWIAAIVIGMGAVVLMATAFLLLMVCFIEDIKYWNDKKR